MRENSYFVVLAYSKPIIYDGKNLEERIAEQKMTDKGFEIHIAKPEGYKFDKESNVMTELSDSYEKMWSTIYPHFRFDRSVIEAFYETFEPLFQKELTVLKRLIWYEFEPNKSL